MPSRRMFRTRGKPTPGSRRGSRTRGSAGQEAARHIRETFEVAPEDCLAIAALSDKTPFLPLADVEKQLTRLKADRERLGGVNLQADEDLVEVSRQLET